MNQQRILDILRDVNFIEGPLNVYLLLPTEELNKELGHEAPVILLFGDYHTGSMKCDKSQLSIDRYN